MGDGVLVSGIFTNVQTFLKKRQKTTLVGVNSKSDTRTITITEVTGKYGLSTDTLRYYERIGLIPQVRRSKIGNRDYGETDCQWIQYIKRLGGAGCKSACKNSERRYEQEEKRMTIFYFTFTGNSLAVAKRIGGTLISIPQVIDNHETHYKDDAIGVIFSVYSNALPRMAQLRITGQFMLHHQQVAWAAGT